jgi:hypothetical protein
MRFPNAKRPASAAAENEPLTSDRFCGSIDGSTSSKSPNAQQRLVADDDEKAGRASYSQSQNPDLEPVENQGLQKPQIDLTAKYRFEYVNEVTWKITDGGGIRAWDGSRSGNYLTTRAIAWLMGIGAGYWVVRYRNRGTRPMRLNPAKRYAIEMLSGIRSGFVIADPIWQLHRYHYDALEPMPSFAEVCAIERADFPPLYRTPTPDFAAEKTAETLKGDDCPREGE